ncbi:MAG: heavy metal translocating P-type ATPase, partial [Fibrobacterota bacterium]
MDHSSNPKENGTHAPSNHHEHMVKNFRKKFIVSAIVTLPILALSPVFGDLVGLQTDIPGKTWILFTLSSFIFLYGGLPFLKGMLKELRERQPAMMTLIALALCVSYIYSTAVVFGLDGKYFFWELATLIDIMLLGHWIEMKSVMRASKATKKLAALLPDTAHRISGNETEDIPVSDIKKGDRLRIKAGEKIPADARVINKGGFVDESMLTGETKPAGKNRDDSITGGSVNGDSIIE